jgi:hypothetical protein
MKINLTLLFIVLFATVTRSQTKLFIETSPNWSYGKVHNSVHYGSKDINWQPGYSVGLGLMFRTKRTYRIYYSFVYNVRRFELNRLKPYSDPTFSTLINREAQGVEMALGLQRKIPISNHFDLSLMAGLTQNLVGKQYQRTIDQFGRAVTTETFGFGSATLRNRIFVRTGVEIHAIPKVSIAIEPTFSAEIKAPFVSTIDKLNPISFSLNVRLMRE